MERKTPENMKEADLLVFDYNSDTSQLEPLDEIGRLYLAKLYLWKHEYEWAEKYLTGFGGQLKPLNHNQLLQLEAIATLDRDNQDPHPLAVALRLKAFAQLLKNRADFHSEKPLDESLLKEMLSVQYPRYLENWRQPEDPPHTRGRAADLALPCQRQGRCG